MARQGNLPGVLAGVTRIEVPCFVAPCGHRFHSRKYAEDHERAGQCWKLPVLRTCQSCAHSRVRRYSDEGDRWYERECQNQAVDTDALPPIHEDVPDVFGDCSGWLFAGAGRKAR